MMEVPILKTWLHSVVVDALESALVDPGQISFNPGAAKQDAPGPDGGKDSSLAQGVLIVTLSLTSGRIRIFSLFRMDSIRYVRFK